MISVCMSDLRTKSTEKITYSYVFLCNSFLIKNVFTLNLDEVVVLFDKARAWKDNSTLDENLLNHKALMAQKDPIPVDQNGNDTPQEKLRCCENIKTKQI